MRCHYNNLLYGNNVISFYLRVKSLIRMIVRSFATVRDGGKDKTVWVKAAPSRTWPKVDLHRG